MVAQWWQLLGCGCWVGLVVGCCARGMFPLALVFPLVWCCQGGRGGKHVLTSTLLTSCTMCHAAFGVVGLTSMCRQHGCGANYVAIAYSHKWCTVVYSTCAAQNTCQAQPCVSQCPRPNRMAVAHCSTVVHHRARVFYNMLCCAWSCAAT